MAFIDLIKDEAGKTSQTKAMGWMAFAVVSLILVRESLAGSVSSEFALGYLGVCVAGRAFSAFNHKRRPREQEDGAP
ncbi:hypothetical protein ACFLQ0_03365 [Nitrospinota bacterium]